MTMVATGQRASRQQWLVDAIAEKKPVAATIDVMDDKVRLKVLLPPMLGMFAGMIQAGLQKKGSVLLEDHSR